jgi:ELMO domain-containing protein
VQPSEVVTFQS